MAALSRLAIVGLAIVADWALPDHAAGGVEGADVQWSSEWTRTLLQPFTRWDAAHFINISVHGYDQDYRFVFFPVFPMVIKGCSYLPWPGMSPVEAGIAGAVVWNVLAFALSAHILHQLLKEMGLRSSLESAMLCFILNPAGVFFTSLYTESTYSLLAWSGLYLWNKNFAASCIVLLLASSTRSNGSLNALVLLLWTVQAVGLQNGQGWYQRASAASQGILGIACCVVPSVAFNIYAYRRLCSSESGDESGGAFEHVGTLCESAWPYGYLQEKYWDVGWMRFYRVRQLPNLLLGLPALCVAGRTIRMAWLTLPAKAAWRDVALHSLAAWTLHLLVLMVVALGWSHVQISTRLLCSSSPLIYWGLGELLVSESARKIMIAYLLLFAAGGTCAHCNFLPWT